VDSIVVEIKCPPPDYNCVKPLGERICTEIHRARIADRRQEPLLRLWKEYCLRATLTAVVWYLRITPQRLAQLLRECKTDRIKRGMYLVGTRRFWKEVSITEAVELLCAYVRAGVAIGHDKISWWALRKWEEACQSDEIMRSIKEILSTRSCSTK
jgi:hypothetical protein